MSIEEKAKAYDEALERARRLEENSNGMILKKWLWNVFPELKESEDERIRKNCMKYLDYEYQHNKNELDRKEIEKCIAWLEKQGDIDKISYDIAEKEKNDFVSGQFIECRKSFKKFKEDNSYWLEYIGNDTYIGRSDNILNEKLHITPRQLFTLFTQEHCPKEDNTNDETNAPTEYGKYVDECLGYAAEHFFSEGEDKYSVADLFYAGVRCGRSWLEKQGEQNPANKVEPKFKVGDWIIDGQLTCKVLSVTSKSYELHLYNDDYRHFETDVQSVDKHYHLWSITDAKPGDVLVWDDSRCIAIFKNIYDEDSFNSYGFVGHCTGKFESRLSYHDIKGAHPATKEQRDLLFQKMKEAGYEWNCINKELKKAETKGGEE